MLFVRKNLQRRIVKYRLKYLIKLKFTAESRLDATSLHLSHSFLDNNVSAPQFHSNLYSILANFWQFNFSPLLEPELLSVPNICQCGWEIQASWCIQQQFMGLINFSSFPNWGISGAKKLLLLNAKWKGFHYSYTILPFCHLPMVVWWAFMLRTKIKSVAKSEILFLAPRLYKVCRFQCVREMSFITSIWKPVL